AATVEASLKAAGYVVAVNIEKPRKGAFVVAVDGQVAVELLDMPRPFKKLRELDLDAAVASIVD
ncbi:hypothetical protein B484DRAFT_330548, partial [Ochromonadaceae sp. CCMP2298]